MGFNLLAFFISIVLAIVIYFNLKKIEKSLQKLIDPEEYVKDFREGIRGIIDWSAGLLLALAFSILIPFFVLVAGFCVYKIGGSWNRLQESVDLVSRLKSCKEELSDSFKNIVIAGIALIIFVGLSFPHQYGKIRYKTTNEGTFVQVERTGYSRSLPCGETTRSDRNHNIVGTVFQGYEFRVLDTVQGCEGFNWKLVEGMHLPLQVEYNEDEYQHYLEASQFYLGRYLIKDD